MEIHQQEHIRSNLYDLTINTNINAIFVSVLKEKEAFGDFDTAELDSIPNRFDKVKRFYEIVITRSNSYDALCDALSETKQSGSLKILKSLKHDQYLRLHGRHNVEIVQNGQPQPGGQGQANPISYPFSPYELFTITDLLMEITMRPCNFVNRPLLSSIKKFIMEDLTHVSGNEVPTQHPFFFPSYQRLVNCLTRADEKYLDNPSGKYIYNQLASKSNRVKRQANPSPSLLTPHSNVLAQGGSLYEEDTSTIDINLSFPYFFVRLHNIMINVCPIEELPSGKFMIEALNEIVKRLMSDQTTFKAAQLKYFHNTPVLKELEECEKVSNVPTPPQQPELEPSVQQKEFVQGDSYEVLD
ncbi:unnamed protein product [Orchesella dallaii]|uniref:Uncharacterized protein n=1 Tax=Orchesella dallaii TaxID=48710 RepID=A0ABP1Q1H1_9HEXA